MNQYLGDLENLLLKLYARYVTHVNCSAALKTSGQTVVKVVVSTAIRFMMDSFVTQLSKKGQQLVKSHEQPTMANK